MRNIPPKVLKTFERIKKKEPSHIELKIIKNNYYIYRATSEWDKERKKVRKITKYIGSIDQRRCLQEEEGEVTDSRVWTRGF